MKIATVCSGIGVAELAARSLGWEPVFMSEIDQHANAVLGHRFPDVPNLGDMTKIEGGQYRGAVDLICGGTPCQGFSIAGQRGGLQDPRSALAIRFVELLASIRPQWFVWENVPGALSSAGGRDFARFLGAISGRAIAVPAGGWKNSGQIAGIPDAYSLNYRVLDAKHFGVPQRRRRVFVVGHLGAEPRPEVLLERKSLQGNIAAVRSPQLSDAARATAGAGVGCIGFTQVSYGQDAVIGVAPTLRSGSESSGILAPAIAFTAKDYGADATVECSPTLRSGEWHSSHANSGVMPAIAAQSSEGYIVRRLTPRECERLQGLDGHTLVPWRGGMMPDGPRYRMLGNAIALPVLNWIFGRIDDASA